ncbi:MAG: hypothetical protein GXX99_00115 [Clostridiales bacterium]|nr:hypothetical protein [Clostridiales bacterium]
MRTIEVGDVVRSTQGRDRGRCFFVLEADARRVTLADGKLRKLASPKRKNRRHVTFVLRPDCPVRDKVLQGRLPIDAEVRKSLAALLAAGDAEG